MTKFKPKESKDYPDWYEIPGYPNNLVNKKGSVLTKKTGKHTKGGDAGRYLKVKLYSEVDDEPILQYVHVLVCLAFYGKPKDGQVVLHLDDDCKNNRSTNLKWGTQSENIKSAHDNGLIKRKTKMQSLQW